MNIDPLTPEERALAQRLAQLGPHGEPSPALDARILAAAHTATSAAPARKPRPRWPVALGIAASLALAVGIAWQLRPLPEAAVYDEAASATTAQAEMSAPVKAANDTAADTFEQPRLQALPPPMPPEMRKERPVARRAPASAPGGAAAKSEPQAFPQSMAPAPAEEPAVVFDEPMPVEAAPAPAPPPPATTTTSRAAAAPAAASESRDAQGYAEKNVASDSTLDTFEADEEVVPPATADSPEVREAWLQRIRELMQTGKTDEARASLREFRHRYPAHPLPDDLRALAE